MSFTKNATVKTIWIDNESGVEKFIDFSCKSNDETDTQIKKTAMISAKIEAEKAFGHNNITLVKSIIDVKSI